MLVVDMVLEHLLSPLQEKLLRFEARKLRQENARLKLSLERVRKKTEAWEEERKKLREQDQLKDNLIKALNERIEKLELTQKTYAGMVFKMAAKHTTSKSLKGESLKRGGKLNHNGKTRDIPKPDRVIEVSLDSCPGCGGKLQGWDSFVSHIVEDIVLPATKTTVSQYLKRRYYCSNCQKEIVPTHPDEIPNSHFGMATLSLILILKQKLHLPLSGIIFLLKNIWGLSLTPAGVQTQLIIAKKLFINPYRQLLKQVRGSPIKHADETTWKVLGKLFWAWIICTKDSSYLAIEETRGGEVADRLLSASAKTSVLVRDDYGGYQKLKLNHQSCWAHLLRKARDYAKLEDSSDEVKLLKGELNEIFDNLNALIKLPFNQQDREQKYQYYLKQIDAIINRLYTHEDVRRVQTRIKNQRENLLTAILYEDVPLTNNQAERDLRGLVIQRKISGSSQSTKGAEVTAVLTSIVSTLNKRQVNLMDGITQLLRGADITTLGL
ncbi:IS66 family transposase [Candidatus Woesebacteria bacterium]|nr:IS66 family transposase [Candidatus Woesebacteria bacterium]